MRRNPAWGVVAVLGLIAALIVGAVLFLAEGAYIVGPDVFWF